jgi:predicted membrane-bound spermidine synthase
MLADPRLTATSQLVLVALGVLIGLIIGTSIALLVYQHIGRKRAERRAMEVGTDD